MGFACTGASEIDGLPLERAASAERGAGGDAIQSMQVSTTLWRRFGLSRWRCFRPLLSLSHRHSCVRSLTVPAREGLQLDISIVPQAVVRHILRSEACSSPFHEPGQDRRREVGGLSCPRIAGDDAHREHTAGVLHWVVGSRCPALLPCPPGGCPERRSCQKSPPTHSGNHCPGG